MDNQNEIIIKVKNDKNWCERLRKFSTKKMIDIMY
jgi:hypothetical protein